MIVGPIAHVALLMMATTSVGCDFPSIDFTPGPGSGGGGENVGAGPSNGGNGAGSSGGGGEGAGSTGGGGMSQGAGGSGGDGGAGGSGGAGGTGGTGGDGGAGGDGGSGGEGGAGGAPGPVCDEDMDDFVKDLPGCDNGRELDCNDEDDRVHPNATVYRPSAYTDPVTEAPSFDYNCNGVEEPRYTNVTCPCVNGTQALYNVAVGAEGCGQTGHLYNCKYNLLGFCQGASADASVVQACR